MKITDIKVNEIKAPEGRHGKQFPDYAAKVLVQVFTDEGLVGIAEGVRNVSVFRAYVDDLIKPLIVGMDPRQPKQIWEILALGIGQRATRFPSQIVGAIDVACWDITGKAAGLPLHTLFGGAHRMTIPLYWSRGNGWKKEPLEMLEEVQEGYERGFRAFKVRMDWKDRRQDINPAKDLAIFQKCREWLPDDVYLAFDANNGYSVPTAIEQGRRFEELGISHFEEPLPQYDWKGLRQVVDALDCAVSSGELEISAWRFRDMMEIANPDILQPDVLNVGGLSEMRRVYEIAEANNKVIMPHSPNVGANFLASLHAYSTVTHAVRPHEFSEEFTGPAEHVAELFIDPIIPKNGTISLTNRPGLGVELDEKALAKAIIA